MGYNATSIALIITTLLALTGCASPGKRTAIGAGAGAAVGAGVGAIAGGKKGALIGAAAGGVAGGVVGNQLDRQAAELEKVAETKRTADGILVNLKNDLTFKTGSAELTEEAKNQLAQISAIFAKYPGDRVTVIGHTDDVGPADFNQKLSQQRASSVQGVLLKNGLPASQLQISAMGESQPIAPNKTPDARAKNRRVELKIVGPTGQVHEG